MLTTKTKTLSVKVLKDMLKAVDNELEANTRYWDYPQAVADPLKEQAFLAYQAEHPGKLEQRIPLQNWGSLNEEAERLREISRQISNGYSQVTRLHGYRLTVQKIICSDKPDTLINHPELPDPIKLAREQCREAFEAYQHTPCRETEAALKVSFDTFRKALYFEANPDKKGTENAF